MGFYTCPTGIVYYMDPIVIIMLIGNKLINWSKLKLRYY